MIAVIVCGVFGVSAVLVRRLFFKNGRLAGFGCKVLASFLFCVAGIFAVLERGIDLFSALMLVAFVLAFAGDILLALAGFADEKSVAFFSMVGGAAFLGGHIMYIAAFFGTTKFHPYLIPIFFVLPILCAFLIKTKRINPGKNTLPVLLYSAVLGAMLTSVINLAASGNDAGILAVIAGALFVFSDTALFFFNFGNEKIRGLHGKLFIFLVHIPYFAAQFLFAATILLI
jgi:uncharacterized membrane protein YhhN